MNKCPNCGGDTREVDRFCLHCGYPLTSTPAINQQEQQNIGDGTLASPDEWSAPVQSPVQHASGETDWSGSNAQTVAEHGTFNEEPATIRAEQPQAVATAQATMDRIERPARLLLRAESGEITQEYPLDKHDITIGRAPASDILLSKDKLTSRRHATIHHENGQYILRDERSANGTFVNGQQIEELTPYTLQEGDHIGVGEHELIFHTYADIEDMPTISVGYNPQSEPMTYRTREDTLATAPGNDDYGTQSMDNSNFVPAQVQERIATNEQTQQESEPQEAIAQQPETSAAKENSIADNSANSFTPHVPESAPGIPVAPTYELLQTSSPSTSEQTPAPVASAAGSSETMQSQNGSSYAAPTMGTAATSTDTPVTFSRLANVSQPNLPDMTALTAALSALDGQVMSLQEQLNVTRDAIQNHDAEIAQTANQLRTGVRRVSERMDATIADVARSREALAWSELSQLMEDVVNNPRDIEYVTKLARKARELNKLFQIHQNVLNTMYECNSLLRGLIGEDR